MPVKVQKAGRIWLLREGPFGRIVGRSKTKAKAEASARIRNSAYRKTRKK